MNLTCPCCDTDFPIEAGFADADGKRLAALMAEFEPALGRAVVGYLRLFKPAKTALRSARAVRLVQELLDLVRPGSVCRDERNGIRRPATHAAWAAGIEQMQTNRPSLTLPLDGHGYLRAVVFAIADQADAKVEREREETNRKVRRPTEGPSPVRAPEDPLTVRLAWLKQQRDYDAIDEAEYTRLVADAKGDA